MVIFVNQTTRIQLVEPVPANTIDHIPAKVYKIEVTDAGVFLKAFREKFNVPDKIYGSKIPKCVKQITEDFKQTQTAVGAMLVGAKGTGKSLAAESIAKQAVLDTPQSQGRGIVNGRPGIYSGQGQIPESYPVMQGGHLDYMPQTFSGRRM